MVFGSSIVSIAFVSCPAPWLDPFVKTKMRLNYSRALSSRWEFSRVWEGKAEDGQLKQSMAIFGDIAARMQVREEKIRS